VPRVKRWFPVNHNINRDPEVWVMRRQIGEKSFSIWMEFLSIADQNESELPGDYDQLMRSVSGTCQSTVIKVRAVYHYAVSQGWIKSDPTLHIAKYWKYHIERDAKKNPTVSLPSEPSEPSEPKKKKKRPSPKVSLPNQLVITDQVQEWATAHGFDNGTVNHEFEKFCSWHGSKRSKFADWMMAFRNWLLKAKEFEGSQEDPMYAQWKPCATCRGEHRPGFCPMGEQ
jgi:hypothetical protein